MTDAPTICFVDIETTGLEPGRHEVWEIALIVRAPGEIPQEVVWQLPVSLHTADPAALRINRFYERYDMDNLASPFQALKEFARLTAGGFVVGSIPSFDAGFLDVALRRLELAPAWHYRLVCVESLAAGKLGMRPPWSTDEMGEKLGVPKDKSDQHTALGDARWAMKVYDAVYAPAARRRPAAPDTEAKTDPVPEPAATVESAKPEMPSRTESSPCSECGIEVEPRVALVSFTTHQRVLCMAGPDGGCFSRAANQPEGPA